MDLRADCRTTDPFFYELQKSKKCIDNDEKNQMSYKKCNGCEYCAEGAILGKGFFLECRITGKQMPITNCPKE